MKKNSQSTITRRGFLGAAASATAFTIVPRHVLAASGETAPSDKLNIACIGVGGMGFNTVRAVMSENIAFLCDVDFDRGVNAVDMFPKAKRYTDYRVMLEKEEKNIDAVAVTTPNHTHIPANVMAMKIGKHVFCEKPLGHNIHEVRMATELAKKTGLATQMGSAAHGSDNYHRVVELIRAGVIGEVREVHAFQDNEWEPVPRVPRLDSGPEFGGRQPAGQPVPKSLNWDLWLGPAPVRPFHSTYHPRHWRGWWDFGGGMLGDMGCHVLDLPFWALDLKYPPTAEAIGQSPVGKEVAPNWLNARWTFGARGDMPPVELMWYDGNTRPDLPEELHPPDWNNGVVFVGSEGMIAADFTRHELFSEGEVCRSRTSAADHRSGRLARRVDCNMQVRRSGQAHLRRKPEPVRLRLWRTADGDGAVGNACLSRWSETRVGPGEPENHEFSRGQPAHRAGKPRGLDVVGVSSAPLCGKLG